jgi:hypothetical protein
MIPPALPSAHGSEEGEGQREVIHLSAKAAVALGYKHALLQPKDFPQPVYDGRNGLRSAGYDKGICQSWPAENFRARAQRHEYAARHRARTRFQSASTVRGGGSRSYRKDRRGDADNRKGQVPDRRPCGQECPAGSTSSD